MEIQARFPYSQIDHTKDTDGHLVVSLVAPSIDWVSNRPKLCILPVIDLSGSMQGSKLEYAKKSVLKLIEHLTPGDICGLYGFESRLHTMVEPGPVTPAFKETLKAAVGKLHVLGGTNFSDALVGAIAAVKKLDLPLSFIQRVIMFTDGQPTEGVTDTKAILRMMEPALGNVTVSAFGYGDVGGGTYNGCDQDFLTELSRQAKGNYAYVKDPDGALAAFGKELGGLLSAYATDIKVNIERCNGHLVTKVVSDVEAEEDVTGNILVTISDLLAEETRHLVFATKLEKQNQAFPRQATVFNVTVNYSVLSSDGKKESKSSEIKARVQFVKPEEAQKEPDKDVDAIVGLAQMIRAQIEAEEEAKKGNYKTASDIMDNMSKRLVTRGLHGLGKVSSNLSASVGSAALYSANAGYLKSVQTAGTRAYGVSSMDGQAQADLQAANVSLSNSTMDSMVQAFTGGEAQAGWVAPDPVVPSITGMGWGGGVNHPLSTTGTSVPGGGAIWVVGQGQGVVHQVQQASPEVPVEASPKPRIKQTKSKARW